MIERSAPSVVHPRVLVVDDDVEVAEALGKKLSYVGYDVEVVTEAPAVLDRLRSERADWDVVVLDVGLPDISGLEVLRSFRDAGSPAAVVMLTGDGSASTAAACLRAGAFHYLTKPCMPVELAEVVESAARCAQRRRRDAERTGVAAQILIGESPAIRRLQDTVDRMAGNEIAVLIQGESGTGKELVARALHAGGGAHRPFVALNCSAIPDSLIDSELFGHARGAFTGADRERDGAFLEAHGGTLFLDEIGDMPLQVQARLLRVLQEGEVRPLGASHTRAVDVRVIAATHVDLAAAVAAGKFREDLYYRLNVVVLRVPALRERREDIALLADHFLRKHAGTPTPELAPEALEVLVRDAWPGNVRELENAIVHAVAFHSGGHATIDLSALPSYLGARAPQRASSNQLGLPLTEAKRQSTAQFERDYLRKVLERAGGSRSEAARLAGIDRTNLRRLLKRYAIDPEIFRRKRR